MEVAGGDPGRQAGACAGNRAFLCTINSGRAVLFSLAGFEVGNGFHQCVQEKANMALFATDNDYRYQPIL